MSFLWFKTKEDKDREEEVDRILNQTGSLDSCTIELLKHKRE